MAVISYAEPSSARNRGLALLRGELSPDSPLWAWAGEAIGRRAETMLDHFEGVEAGEDIEAVHDMRVGSRRLAAAMKVFHGCYPDRKYDTLFREARRVTRRLGGVRDLDVLIDHYRKLRPGCGSDEATAIDYLIAVYSRQRDQARGPMLAALRKTAETHFPDRLRSYLRRHAEAYAVGLGPELPGNASCERAFREAAPGFLDDKHGGLYAFEPYVALPEAKEELHEMRIAAKWFRYTMELFAAAYSDGLAEPLAAVKKLQELLGDLHDSDVRLDLVREALAAPLHARGLVAVGLMLPDTAESGLAQLEAREARTRDACYRKFYKEWRRLESRDFRRASLARIRHPDAAAA